MAFDDINRPMMKRFRLGIVTLAVVAGCCALPWAWRIGTLRWAKWSALHRLATLTPAQLANLDKVPQVVSLRRVLPEAIALETVNISSFVLCVPHAESREYPKSEDLYRVILNYPRFKVGVVKPFSTANADAQLRTEHLPCAYDFRSAAYRLRLDDIRMAPDLASLRGRTLLLAEKMEIINMDLGRKGYFEDFRRDDMCGFVIPPARALGLSAHAEAYFPQLKVSVVLWFIPSDKVLMSDIHDFLSVLEITPESESIKQDAAICR